MPFKNDEEIAVISQTPRTVGDVLEPTATIDSVLHKRVMLKLDAVVLGCFGVIYLLANLDRNNLVSASLAVGHSDQPA
jgi:hypothetical protein